MWEKIVRFYNTQIRLHHTPRFYRSDEPTNSVIALKDNVQLTRPRAIPTMLSSTNSVIALKDNVQLTRPRAIPTMLSSIKSKIKNLTNKFKYTEHHEDQRNRNAGKTES